LCYAFIGFDNDQSCEEAYFKMNNAIIDDRRIKVGFLGFADDALFTMLCSRCFVDDG